MHHQIHSASTVGLRRRRPRRQKERRDAVTRPATVSLSQVGRCSWTHPGKPQAFRGRRRPSSSKPAPPASPIVAGSGTAETARPSTVPPLPVTLKTMFPEQPTGEFGLEFQVDFAQRGLGRALQMTYCTGTNEAWVKADKFLKVTIAK